MPFRATLFCPSTIGQNLPLVHVDLHLPQLIRAVFVHSQWGKLAENIDISQSNQSQLWSQNSQCTVDVYSHKGVIHRLAPTQWCPWNRQALYCMSARRCVRTRQKIWSCYARLLNNKNHLLLVKKLQASRSTYFAKWIRSMVHQKDKN